MVASSLFAEQLQLVKLAWLGLVNRVLARVTVGCIAHPLARDELLANAPWTGCLARIEEPAR